MKCGVGSVKWLYLEKCSTDFHSTKTGWTGKASDNISGNYMLQKDPQLLNLDV